MHPASSLYSMDHCVGMEVLPSRAYSKTFTESIIFKSVFTCFLVWIIVVDLQPVKHITVLTSHRDTDIFWKFKPLWIQGYTVVTRVEV